MDTTSGQAGQTGAGGGGDAGALLQPPGGHQIVNNNQQIDMNLKHRYTNFLFPGKG